MFVSCVVERFPNAVPWYYRPGPMPRFIAIAWATFWLNGRLPPAVSRTSSSRSWLLAIWPVTGQGDALADAVAYPLLDQALAIYLQQQACLVAVEHRRGPRRLRRVH